MNRTRSTRTMFSLGGIAAAAWLLLPSFALAADDAAPADAAAAAKPVVHVVIQSLENPSGIAVQPKTNHVFVATRPAVYRLVPGKPGEHGTVHLVVHSYPTDVYGKGPMYDIGPLGLAFLKQNLLVVGDGSRKDGEELVRVYEVGDTPDAHNITTTTSECTAGRIGMTATAACACMEMDNDSRHQVRAMTSPSKTIPDRELWCTTLLSARLPVQRGLTSILSEPVRYHMCRSRCGQSFRRQRRTPR